MEILQIIRNLGFTSFIVRISAPDFQFNYKLLAPIVNDQIHPFLIAGLGFYIAISHPIDDWLQK